MKNSYDVIIVGAGPAGTACALALKDSGLQALLIDKHSFPRDKVCGDAIPHRAVRVLRQLSGDAYAELSSFAPAVHTRGCRIVAPDKGHADIQFKLEGFTCARMDFDDFLFRHAGRQPHVHTLTGQAVNAVSFEQDRVVVAAGPQSYFAAAVVGCDGAHSIVQKCTTGLGVDPRHHTAAVRAYYENISGTEPGLMEIHLFREFPAAYFWIFPLTDHVANVGIGMLSETISNAGVSLYKVLSRITSEGPLLGERFARAALRSRPRGFGLPMGSRRVPVSGARFLLCGDAASLIDPATGEGIGNAMWSGQLAAGQLKRCFATGDFSAGGMRPYDQAVRQAFDKEMRRKYMLQRLLADRPWLANMAIRIAMKSSRVRGWMQKLF